MKFQAAINIYPPSVKTNFFVIPDKVKFAIFRFYVYWCGQWLRLVIEIKITVIVNTFELPAPPSPPTTTAPTPSSTTTPAPPVTMLLIKKIVLHPSSIPGCHRTDSEKNNS